MLALGKLKQQEQLRAIPVNDYVAATSVGIVAGMPLLDLAYEEDSKADVDMNIVKTGDGRFIEIQGTAEAEPFGSDALTGLLALADRGITELIAKQREIVGSDPRPMNPRLQLLIATTNPNKVREIRPLLARRRRCELVTLADVAPIPEPEETGSTFWENARIKALAYARGDRD